MKRLVKMSSIPVGLLVAIEIYLKAPLFISVTIFPDSASFGDSLFRLLDFIQNTSIGLLSVFVAVYIIVAQLAGRKPYSRSLKVIYKPGDIMYFAILFAFIIYLLIFNLFSDYIVHANAYYWLEVTIILFLYITLISVELIVYQLLIFRFDNVVQRVLENFNLKTMKQYGLVYLQDGEFVLRKWGHAHHFEDPLGAFQDLITESIDEKDRLRFQYCLMSLIKRLSSVCGFKYQRIYPFKFKKTDKMLRKIKHKRILLRRCSNEDKILAVIFAIHYTVIYSKEVFRKWQIDNHRQSIMLVYINFMLSILNAEEDEDLMILTAYALANVCETYKDLPRYGSYEPFEALLSFLCILRNTKYKDSYELLIRIVGYFCTHSDYLVNNPIFDYDKVIGNRKVRKNITTATKRFQNSSLDEVIPNDIFSGGKYVPTNNSQRN